MPNGPLDWIDDSLTDLAKRDLRRYRRVGINQVSDVDQSGSETLSASNRALVNFSTNDYLGLANDPRLAEAAKHAAALHGWGAGASPVVSGRTSQHALLEERLAEFEQAEAAILFPSGFAANAGIIPALVEEGDALFTDEKNHASLIDGCRLSTAERHIYPHSDVKALEKLLETTGPFRRRLIVTDSLFSMDGDFAPLDELGRLAAKHNAMLMVDEAHATGVWGKKGRGAVEHFAAKSPELEEQVTIRVGTLSKAFGSAGGFVTGERRLIDWLYNRARSYVFSTAPPAALAAAAIEALKLVQEEPERRYRVHQLALRVRTQLESDGWNLGDSKSQIIPLIVGSPEVALKLSEHLNAAGCYVPAIRPPSVPQGESLLRISLSASHTDDQIGQLLSTLKDAQYSMQSV